MGLVKFLYGGGLVSQSRGSAVDITYCIPKVRGGHGVMAVIIRLGGREAGSNAMIRRDDGVHSYMAWHGMDA